MDRSDNYLLFADTALEGMARIVSELGDELANRRPELPNANSPYQILTHCLGVVEFWVGHLIAGRENHRDRDAEFRSGAAVSGLLSQVEKTRQRLADDLAHADLTTRVEGVAHYSWMPPDRDFTQEMALLHVVRELCQHHGQMELTRDILKSSSGPAGKTA